MNRNFAAGHEAFAARHPDIDRPPVHIDWEEIKEARRDNDVPWEDVAETLKQRAAVEEAYEAGDTTSGRRFWDNRDESLPESLYYYHGIFA